MAVSSCDIKMVACDRLFFMDFIFVYDEVKVVKGITYPEIHS